jgi:hypothetical protein
MGLSWGVLRQRIRMGRTSVGVIYFSAVFDIFTLSFTSETSPPAGRQANRAAQLTTYSSPAVPAPLFCPPRPAV